ncbi:maleylacetoacetate isomerase [Maliponia aquimaris]|uniref:Maleylpyruvate isomerase n=1 Tax=Maliponia aquimaris TaxID=1673631 RepID=A0A238KE11_9RHOB|nr:maleylacetoacetate isomerase [Maliponia aquimaris]SMX41030.1 Maleylpyruvate isomerase [Maliponia aquimaris]
MSDPIVLHDYWRSSACYRVRIALNLLGLAYTAHPVDLLAGEHRSPAYLALNPQGLVPSLQIDGQTLTQSLAILDYLQARTPGAALLPDDPLGQYRARQLSHAIAMEIHQVCNLSVANHAASLAGGDDAVKSGWMRHFIGRGLAAVEAMLPADTAFCLGETPGMADCCLVPQVYNADRWGVDLAAMPRIRAIAGACAALEPFQRAHPDAVRPPA